MKGKQGIVTLLALISTLSILFAGCGTTQEGQTPSNQGQAKPVETRLLLGTSSQGGTYYVWGGGWAKIMGETVPGTDISVEVTGGPASNIQLIQKGEMDLGFATSWLAGEAYSGTGWAKEKYDQIRAIFPMYASVMHIYSLKDKGIKTIGDFNGKHVTTGAPGSTSDLAGRALLEVLGVKPSKISSLPTNTAIDNLRDGTVDAGFAVTGVPGPFMLDLETTHTIQHIGLSQEEMDKVIGQYPYWSQGVIPKGTYKHQTEDTPVVAFWNIAIASKNLSEDLVYNLVKATFEKHEALLAVDPSAKETIMENVINSTIPLHPGAIKYYREKGMQIPDNLIPEEAK
ncbi:TAXI family TRAP transporter solute-binding subunit [Brevibacillus sp. B_LB10_24]|uniref:TAXI family TRAP transporter solute-binding subunit n=1 Tax=Brevibacillus sp. B_LB10_24 TaxID=3380645 RepID=UPI0038B75F5A